MRQGSVRSKSSARPRRSKRSKRSKRSSRSKRSKESKKSTKSKRSKKLNISRCPTYFPNLIILVLCPTKRSMKKKLFKHLLVFFYLYGSFLVFRVKKLFVIMYSNWRVPKKLQSETKPEKPMFLIFQHLKR